MQHTQTGAITSSAAGQYGTAEMLAYAAEQGFTPKPEDGIMLAKCLIVAQTWDWDSGPDLGILDLSDWLYELSEDAEAWLNDHRAPKGHAFGWYDGVFALWTEDDWLGRQA